MLKNKPKKKVLIVDDNSDIRKSVSLALQEQDLLEIEVTESDNVTSGIEQLKKVRPDIVILDIHMPGKSGFDFIDYINKNHLTKTKVIMLSADDTLTNIFKAGDKGINEFLFLGKPFNISELQALVLGLCFPSKT